MKIKNNKVYGNKAVVVTQNSGSFLRANIIKDTVYDGLNRVFETRVVEITEKVNSVGGTPLKDESVVHDGTSIE